MASLQKLAGFRLARKKSKNKKKLISGVLLSGESTVRPNAHTTPEAFCTRGSPIGHHPAHASSSAAVNVVETSSENGRSFGQESTTQTPLVAAPLQSQSFITEARTAVLSPPQAFLRNIPSSCKPLSPPQHCDPASSIMDPHACDHALSIMDPHACDPAASTAPCVDQEPVDIQIH